METLYIKNMVCDRCKMAVGQSLKEKGLHVLNVELGEVKVEETLSAGMRSEVRASLESLGFELLDDKRQQTIDKIKSAIISLVHYHDNNSALNLSAFLSSELHQEYSALSKLFSEVEGKTIERYYIEQRIEKVKELIKYDELSLTQIAMKMNYSSTAYLSSQFKSVTGMTPSQFKRLKTNTRFLSTRFKAPCKSLCRSLSIVGEVVSFIPFHHDIHVLTVEDFFLQFYAFGNGSHQLVLAVALLVAQAEVYISARASVLFRIRKPVFVPYRWRCGDDTVKQYRIIRGPKGEQSGK